jgi:hypothetical protein
VNVVRNDDGAVTVRLSQAEALVLSDALHRWESDGTLGGLSYQDQAEQRVVWDLVASLEPVIEESFDPDYGVILGLARDSLRDQ